MFHARAVAATLGTTARSTAATRAASSMSSSSSGAFSALGVAVGTTLGLGASSLAFADDLLDPLHYNWDHKGPLSSYNPYFPGGAIGMPKQLADGAIDCEKGTPLLTEQMAKEIVLDQMAEEIVLTIRYAMGYGVLLQLNKGMMKVRNIRYYMPGIIFLQAATAKLFFYTCRTKEEVAK